MSVSLSVFLPDVLPYVPRCPEMIATHAIREAVIEFCERTLLWRTVLPGMPALKDQATYALTPPAETRIVSVLGVALDGTPVDPASADDLDATNVGWRADGASFAYVIEDPKTLTFTSAPTADSTGDGIVVSVAIKPTQAGSECGELLYEDWKPAIAAGALARLKLMADKEWTAPTEAAQKQGVFDAAISAGIARARRGHARVQHYARPPRTI